LPAIFGEAAMKILIEEVKTKSLTFHYKLIGIWTR